ncbi:MAG: hypothetical protein A3A04_01000 [Candidatus Harrisonbacteria bacterium RIFCSPLOWO2_01_FULL_40_28]|uniref:Uncharacterized protein n=1 Tax=Candidatus Harrisonbacteria bacterium RIFCSPLOWO2_01_FULL_40_28 TaxID=1798406 RepID=A0A1G1ZN94_9BACT|nr:MAG: hypothetical protein A3A04_01000 [Candidatus Harrisonbacteria bacterium RIFCSPLOWO2_01_FULL_40_28]
MTKTHKHKKQKKILKILVIIGGLFFIGSALGVAYIASLAATIPDPAELGNQHINQSTKIFDRTGENLLYEVYGEENRTVIPFEEIPRVAREATIAVEDQLFYTHRAFDTRAIIRAAWSNIKKVRFEEGASTITQQLAKNTFLTREKTLSRKIKELLLALWLERTYSKDKILELYLNQIPYGANAYGIEAASKTYFNKPARDITLNEAATLASLLKAPSYYSPWGTHVPELIARKNYVLKQMASLGFITKEEKEVAEKTLTEFVPVKISGIKAPHFVLTVQEYLNKKYGEDFVRTSGLTVITTLDIDLQTKAEDAVKKGALRNEELYKGTNAALVAEETATGQILALVGSRDYFDTTATDGNFNVATQGLRQPGSTIKPFIYLSAFQKGYTPDTVVFDLPTEFDASGNPERSYMPHNFDDKFVGPITLKDALAQSRNVPSVKTLYLTGLKDALELARQFGITTLKEQSRYGLSLVLGGGEVRLIDLVHAYGTIAQEGVRHNQSFILSIKDASGKTLEEYKDSSETVSDPQAPRLINSILSDVELRRPLFHGSLNQTIVDDHEIALKTGTTNDYRDAWTIGYTKDLVVGVWAGNNDNAPMQKQGGSILAALPIWHTFMSEALKEKTSGSFTRPDPIVVEKPVLRGQYLVTDQTNQVNIHEILYYVEKNNPQGDKPSHPENDPQFYNWENPVIEWAKTNITTELLRTMPSLINQNTPSVDFVSPKNGDYIRLSRTATVQVIAPSSIKKIELYFNDSILESASGDFGTSYTHIFTLKPNRILPQNLLTVKAFDSNNNELQKSIILFE